MTTNALVCPSCGEKNNPALSRCWKCGYILNQEKADAETARLATNPPKKKQSMIIPIIIGITVGVVMSMSRTMKKMNEVSPQKVTLTVRVEETVARGQASLRLMPDVEKEDSDEETVGENPVVDVKCGRKELHQIKLTTEPSESVCGVQVRLLRVYKNGKYPRVDAEVTW